MTRERMLTLRYRDLPTKVLTDEVRTCVGQWLPATAGAARKQESLPALFVDTGRDATSSELAWSAGLTPFTPRAWWC